MQANRARTTRCWPWCRTRTSTAMTSRTQDSSRTWRPDARRGTTATWTAGKRRSCVQTARSSAKPCLCATGGSTSGAISARNYTTSTSGCTGRRHDRTDRTECSPRSCLTGYSSEGDAARPPIINYQRGGGDFNHYNSSLTSFILSDVFVYTHIHTHTHQSRLSRMYVEHFTPSRAHLASIRNGKFVCQ